MEVRNRVTVDPPAEVETCVMVVALGVGVVDVEMGCDEDDDVNDELEIGVEELDGSEVLLIEEDEELMGRVVEDDEMMEESEVETGVGLLLAIELDD